MLKYVKQPYALLILINIAIWGLAFFVYRNYPISLSLCLLAYGFGLRHGIDADHVAAIDSVTRKLLEKNQNQGYIGFFFSLGHSTIVIILSALVAITAASIHGYFPSISKYGTMLGGFFSVFFLLVFATANLFILLDVVKKIKNYDDQAAKPVEIKVGGFLSKILRPVLKIVTKSWHMYFVGFLFGLGFDTATEVAILGISAYTVTQHISIWAIMIFPALFTAGMCLVDTTSGLLILRACRWAYIDPARKLYYNLTVTLFSFLTAFIIAGYEIFSILSSSLGLNQGMWTDISSIGNHFEWVGVFIVILFVSTWLIAARLYRKSIN